MSYIHGLAGSRGREQVFGAARTPPFVDQMETGSITSSWEEDPTAPGDIRLQLQYLQGMILKKSKECQDQEARTRLEMADLEKQLLFSESERQRLVDDLASLKAGLATHPPIDQAEVLQQATNQLREEFDLARMHDELMRRNEAERHARV